MSTSMAPPNSPQLQQAQVLVKQWLDDERIRPVDWHLARQAVEYEIDAGNTSDDALTALFFAATACSFVLGRGQVCIELGSAQNDGVVNWGLNWGLNWVLPDISSSSEYAALKSCFTLENLTACNVVNRESGLFVLNNNRLYLSRYFAYERQVLTQLVNRLSASPVLEKVLENTDTLAQSLKVLFPTTNNGSETSELDWQAIAAAVACVQPITVITGGPGTGKTTTVTKLLSALLSQTPDLRIALAAPTGKAAARMTESIRQAREKIQDASEMHGIPSDSFTLHRLLGWSPRGFRYNAQRHLPFDCVVVDEASMIDLPMMAHLFNALSPSTRIILLGDRDQLASVEAGSVLADLCDAGTEHGFTQAFATHLSAILGSSLPEGALTQLSEVNSGPMQNAVVQLRKSHRFSADSGIGALARAVNNGDQHAAADAFNQYDDVHRISPDSENWQRNVIEGYRHYCALIQAQDQADADAEAILNAFDEFQVLVALRKGHWGVEETNRQIERLLSRAGLLKNTAQQWYSGRAVMITRNDYDLGLFNGDIGILIASPAEDGAGKERVAFRAADGGVRYMSPGRLPSHETAFAITVHKSQGSEFRDVLLLLPEQWQQVITRELIYTAVTRAKSTFTCQTGQACWAQGLTAQVTRASGLREALWGK